MTDSFSLTGKSILIVDDEPDLRDAISQRFIMDGAIVSVAENGNVALEAIKKQRFDAIVSDIRMPGGNGLDLLKALPRSERFPAVVLISGFADIRQEEVLNEGAAALIVKPFDLDELIEVICKALDKKPSGGT